MSLDSTLQFLNDLIEKQWEIVNHIEKRKNTITHTNTEKINAVAINLISKPPKELDSMNEDELKELSEKLLPGIEKMEAFKNKVKEERKQKRETVSGDLLRDIGAFLGEINPEWAIMVDFNSKQNVNISSKTGVEKRKNDGIDDQQPTRRQKIHDSPMNKSSKDIDGLAETKPERSIDLHPQEISGYVPDRLGIDPNYTLEVLNNSIKESNEIIQNAEKEKEIILKQMETVSTDIANNESNGDSEKLDLQTLESILDVCRSNIEESEILQNKLNKKLNKNTKKLSDLLGQEIPIFLKRKMFIDTKLKESLNFDRTENLDQETEVKLVIDDLFEELLYGSDQGILPDFPDDSIEDD